MAAPSQGKILPSFPQAGTSLDVGPMVAVTWPHDEWALSQGCRALACAQVLDPPPTVWPCLSNSNNSTWAPRRPSPSCPCTAAGSMARAVPSAAWPETPTAPGTAPAAHATCPTPRGTAPSTPATRGPGVPRSDHFLAAPGSTEPWGGCHGTGEDVGGLGRGMQGVPSASEPPPTLQGLG